MYLRLGLAATAVAGAAAGGFHYAALWPGSALFGKSLIAGTDPDEVALTYDDGPNQPYTLQLLEVLARHQVRATFFLIGRYGKAKPGIVRDLQAAGHLIGNHSLTHPRLMYASSRRIREELTDATRILEDLTGAPVRYFRPPFGARRPAVFRILRELGQIPVLWNVTGSDWNAPSAASIDGKLRAGLLRNRRRGRGSNILLHDGSHLQLGTDRRRSIRATENLLAVPPYGGLRYVTVDAWAGAFSAG